MSGITVNTKNNLIYGTRGYITVNGIDLGATREDFSVEWNVEQYYPDLAQSLGPVTGTGRVIQGEFRMMTRMTEWTFSVLSYLLGSYGYSEDANSERIGGGNLGLITEVETVILTGLTRNDNKAVKVTIPQAYVTAGSPSFSKSQESVLEVTFNGLYTPERPYELPGFIEIAK